MSDQAPRESIVQQEPVSGRDYSGFPVRVVLRGQKCHRVHRNGVGAWFFASDGGGRFDLPQPMGTCYVASTEQTAAREAIGPDFIKLGMVPDSFVAERVVTAVTLPFTVRAAKLTDDAAFIYGITSELSASSAYNICQKWAWKFHEFSFAGVWYQPRFSPGVGRALAVFGEAGPAKYESGSPEPLRLVVDKILGLRVVETQDLGQYEVLDDPGF